MNLGQHIEEGLRGGVRPSRSPGRRWALASVNSWPTTATEGLRLLALPDGASQVVYVEPERRRDRQDRRERRVARLTSLKSAKTPRCEPSLVRDVFLAERGTKAGTPDVPAQARDEVVELHAGEVTANRKCEPGHMIPETCCSNEGSGVRLQSAPGNGGGGVGR